VRSPPPLNRRGPPKGVRGRERPEPDVRWLWGVHAVAAALANPRRRIERLVATRNGSLRVPGHEAELVEPAALDQLLPPGAVHQGIALRAEPLSDVALEDACFPADGRALLMLDGVTDPQNVGAIFRTAAAFGARAIIMQDRKSPPLTGALAKAAAGAIEIVPHVRVVNLSRTLEQLAQEGYTSIGLEGEAEMALDAALALAANPVIVLGAEGAGLRDQVAAHCDIRARIPIESQMESLNVSAATAVALYAARQRLR
jgi:23S rRNA (guanosine2251-2'-O)-methyltransferase